MLLSAVIVAGCKTPVSDRNVRRAEIATAVKWMEGSDNVLLIDARSEADYAEGHIPGAFNVQLRDAETPEVTDRLNKAGRVVIYGRDPGSARATALAKRFITDGRKDVWIMEEGIAGWQDRGFPLVR